MLSDYRRNQLIDYLYRGQAHDPGTELFIALGTAASAASATEQTGGGVARVEVTSALANWAGTQAPGTTSASSGTTGTTSNNAAIEFAASASAEISASHVLIYDAASGGNYLESYRIVDSGGNPITRTWQIGDPVQLEAGALQIVLT
jgi:hypothetical protein